MKKEIVLFALAAMLILASPASALECQGSWRNVQEQAPTVGMTIDRLPALARKEVGDFYNKTPPEADHDYTEIAFVSGPRGSFLLFMVKDCIVFFEPNMTPERLMLLMRKQNI